MNELLLFSGALGKQYFPESGPGNKNLRAGNEDIGYFGTVSSVELFQGWEISTALNFTAGLVNKETDNVWMKFIYKGKFLFVCKDFTRYNLSWNDVYKAGAMYGMNSNGPYPVAGSPTSQWNILVKPESGVTIPWKLAIRTMKGASVDPYVGVDYTAFGLAEGNEHNDLIFRLLTTGANGRPNTGLFEKWPGVDLGAGGNTTLGILQETSAANVANAMFRGPTGVTAGGAKATVRATSDGWRPVLELVSGENHAFNPYALYSQYTGNAGPLSVTGVFTDVVYSPVLLTSSDASVVKVPSSLSATFIDQARRPQNLTVVNQLLPVSMSFTRT
jgi:hypothetical protein